MKCFVLAGIVLLAMASGPAAAQFYPWYGCYVGADVGYAWGRDSDSESVFATGAASPYSPPSAANPNGMKGGGYFGCNYQMGTLVLGFEGDGEWANLNGSTPYASTQNPPDKYAPNLTSEGSIRARVGISLNQVLLYGTAGVAFANVTEQYFYNGPSAQNTSISAGLTGWTAGVGVEYALNRNLLWRLEYRYAGFDNLTTYPWVFISPNASYVENHSISESVIRLGLTFKFN